MSEKYLSTLYRPIHHGVKVRFWTLFGASNCSNFLVVEYPSCFSCSKPKVCPGF